MKIGNLDIDKLYLGSDDDVKVYLGDVKVYPSEEPFVPKDYLRFKAVNSGTFSFIAKDTNSANTISYSLDSGQTWTTIGNNQNTATVSAGSYIYWKGNNVTVKSGNGWGTFTATADFNVEGNAMSMLFDDEFEGQTSLNGKTSAFMNMFSGNTHVIDASQMKLPATTLATQCYTNMFNRATRLTKAPSLTAATTLTSNCYQNMFYSASSLTTTVSFMLPATTLVIGCYQQMFYKCSNVNKITCLATSGINSNSSTTNWVNGVSTSSSGVFTRASGISWITGNNGRPANWQLATYSG